MKVYYDAAILAAVAFSRSSIASPVPLNDASSSNALNTGFVTPRQAESFFSITGAQVGGVQPRLEIRQLQTNTEQWNVFLLGLAKFEAMDQSDKLSYFQLAAIHGAPYIAWDGVNGTGKFGYCTHGSNLFGPWHRPYLAVFEQILLDRVSEVVDEFPEGDTKDKYQEAANNLRLPYWDWALPAPSGDGVLPNSAATEDVDVTFPNGTTASIPNPLFEYAFHPLNPSDFPFTNPAFDEWQTTIRYPQNSSDPNATSRNDQVNAVLTANQGANKNTVYKLLTQYQGFNNFSNKGSGGTSNNLETLHDGIHGDFGLGNMGIVPVAAFDPIFWLHHANVDRIMAIFQARYPDTYVLPYKQSTSTYTAAAGTVLDTNSALTPFHRDSAGDFWTGEQVRKTDTFGYTYPELVGNPSNDTLTATINTLYGPTQNGISVRRSLDARNTSQAKLDYLAEVRLPNIGKTYAVRVFLGAPSSNPENWPTDPNYVGQVANLDSPNMNSDLVITASVHLTEPLLEKFLGGALNGTDEQAVVQYLKTNLHWRIQNLDLTEIPRSEAPQGLDVTVTSIEVEQPKSASDVPKWVGDFKPYPEITGN